ncbi:trypsin-like peptidase domain-containing protein [Rhodopseudomonas palustris]|uniref:S1C family serine protease n=1 Tax=Rhodopseudomonas palustris TaxID=1076 RepID=UPI002ACED964|nr:trypsin-like peptidase domain-containing protein [Rhodopseudomonas palustris]WQH01339.1 trypsin-like peptidase domain-containing protein [Rhodopseudomonas palustris]
MPPSVPPTARRPDPQLRRAQRTDLLLRIAVIWLLLLATAWVAQPYLASLWFSVSGPRTVTARGDLAPAETATIELFKRVSPSVVHVFAQSSRRSPSLFEQQQGGVQSGSGVIWDAAGHVITNNHVIQGAGALGARLSTGEFVTARVVGTAPNYDLAVLQLERPRAALRPIAIGSSSDLQVGQSAFAIGSPYGLEQTLTTGIVSALQRRLPTAAAHEISGVIQTDAAINPGNSGGPLLDSAGRLIGLNTAIISGSGASAGIGFAIPVDSVNRIATALIKTGTVPVPGIGIIAADENEAARLGIDGVVVVRTLPDSPAARAGLTGASETGMVEDVIVGANGQEVHSMSDLAATLERVGIGNEVKLQVIRDGRARTVNVQVTDIARLRRS